MANTSKAAANTPYRFVSFIRDSSRAQALDIICFTLTLVPACVNAKSRRDCRGCVKLKDGPFETRAPRLMAGAGCFFPRRFLPGQAVALLNADQPQQRHPLHPVRQSTV